MLSPKGYNVAKPGDVCRLRWSLYGLKQASRQWNVELSSKLKELGFHQSIFYPCLFIKRTGSSFLTLLVYVNDVLIVGSHEDQIMLANNFLDSAFTIKDLSFAKYFLGVEIARHPHGMYLNHQKYILDILTNVGLSGAKPFNTPLLKGQKFSADCGSPLVDLAHYSQLVGHLLYLNFTLPDITYSIQQLNQFVSSL